MHDLVAPIRVFLSYSWDNESHKQRVLELAQRLRADGIDAWIDRFTPFPPEGWPRWMEQQIAQAQFVVIVGTETYARRFAGNEPAGRGAGASWEGLIVTQELYDANGRNNKFLPAIFSRADSAYIPRPLQPSTRFSLFDPDGYDLLYRQITGQPEIIPAPLGTTRVLLSSTGSAAQTVAVPLPILQVYDHAAAHSNLPILPYGFFGREDEAETVAEALKPNARGWGILIDGPGGIGKTALAIHVAHLAPAGQFARIVFLSAKGHELTPDGKRPLHDFIVSSYLEMLNELARQIGHPDLSRSDDKQRPLVVQQALQEESALIIFDNLESLFELDRDRLFSFLNRLPASCKAIATSRRRTDVGAPVLRLGKLRQPAAMKFITSLAKNNPRLRRATKQERVTLYNDTGGNPLLIRWVAGQMRRAKGRTIAAALKFLAEAPPDNDPLKYILGDLASSFTSTEVTVLVALSHFTLPTEVKFVAEISGSSFQTTENSLEDLADRALVTPGDAEGKTFVLLSQVANFLRRTQPEIVKATGSRLVKRAYALAVENGFRKYSSFHILESKWPIFVAALPLLFLGSNEQLQTVCSALSIFLDFSGRWDERISLSQRAEERAVEARDFKNAGWRAFEAGFTYTLRQEGENILACADRCAAHWKAKDATTHQQATALRLRGLGLKVKGDSSGAREAFQKAIEIWRGSSGDSLNYASALGDLADIDYKAGNLEEAERRWQEALKIREMDDDTDGRATYLSNLAIVAAARNDWTSTEKLARQALKDCERSGRRHLIASNSYRLAHALKQLGNKVEALPYVRTAVSIFKALRSSQVDSARALLAECEIERS